MSLSRLFRHNVSYSLYGQLSKVFLFGLFIFLLAKVIGPEEFGRYTSILASTAILFSLIDLGFSHILIKETANHNDNYNGALGKTIKISLINLFVFSLLLFWFNVSVLKISPWEVFLVIIVDFVFYKINDINSKGFQAHGDIKRSSIIFIGLGVAKLISLVISIILFDELKLIDFLIVYLVISSLLVLVTTYKLWIIYGHPKFKDGNRYSVREGIHFAIGTMSKSIYVDSDKIILTKMTNSGITGFYSIGYKYVSMAYIPIQALLFSKYHEFFKLGSKGIYFAYKEAKKISKISILYGIIAAIFLYITAPVLSTIMGEGYEDVKTVVRILLFIPFIQSIYYPYADALTGSGYQKERSRIQVGGILINVFLTILLIKNYSWYGAAIASVLTEFLLAISIFIILKMKMRGKVGTM